MAGVCSALNVQRSLVQALDNRYTNILVFNLYFGEFLL